MRALPVGSGERWGALGCLACLVQVSEVILTTWLRGWVQAMDTSFLTCSQPGILRVTLLLGYHPISKTHERESERGCC